MMMPYEGAFLRSLHFQSIVTTLVVHELRILQSSEQTTVEVEVMICTPGEQSFSFDSEKEAIHLILTGIGGNELPTSFLQKCSERRARNANPINLFLLPQTLQDLLPNISKLTKSYAQTSKASLPTRILCSYKYKAKEIAKLITHHLCQASEEDQVPTGQAHEG
ncbi:hypothetical protein Tco_0655443 [Tanacetum coccineum]|uniref:Uncharacterized protein n=1 Tax=Tanacetum coccineum TaxID=301880 RepID=A0ABQ4X614_9ASTR